MRYRRPAQRRQVHPVQRPDQGRHRGRELPVLHHRAQRRHRAGARPAPRCHAGRDRQAAEGLPTTMEFVDIAGLVAGASKGEGLGNKFLANIRETDAIAHVVRCFDNDDVVHVAGKVDPLDDIEVINTELALADLETVERPSSAPQRAAKTGDKEAIAPRRSSSGAARTWTRAAAARARPQRRRTRSCELLHLLTLKPTMYIANVDEDGFEDNPLLDAGERARRGPRAPRWCRCARDRGRDRRARRRGARRVPRRAGLEEPGLDRVIRAGYRLLGLQTYFTAGAPRRCAPGPSGRRHRPQAAGVIHTDFQKGFIRAEVIAYDDFVACTAASRAPRRPASGAWRARDYVVQRRRRDPLPLQRLNGHDPGDHVSSAGRVHGSRREGAGRRRFLTAAFNVGRVRP
jgi:ribosome-binding ATPase